MPRVRKAPGSKARALQGELKNQTSALSLSGQQVEEYSNNVLILP